MERKIEITGQWIKEKGKIVGDQSCKIIKHLIDEHFVEINEREGGWTILYINPLDNSYWELTYPQSEMHGGGPPKLEKLNEEEIKERYGELKI